MLNSGFKLYQITNEYQKAIDALLNNEDGAQIELDKLKDTFDNKIINTVKYMRNIESEYNAVKSAADAMTERARGLAKEIEFLERYMLTNLEETGLVDAIKCPEFSVKIQSNPASVEIVDAALVPDAYITEEVVKKINKNAIKQDIKDGFDVEGVKLVVKKRLVIK